MLKHPEFLPASLLLSSRRTSVLAGEHLFQRGQVVTDLHWILRGEVVAVRNTLSGQEAVMMRGRSGEFFAEAALFTPAYTCDGIARKPTELLCLPLNHLRPFLQRDFHFADSFLWAMVLALRRQCSRVERLRLHGAAHRIEHFLSCETAPDGWCDLGLPLSEWAIELGLEPETLYRTLRTLEQQGKLQRDGRRLRPNFP